MYPRKLVGLCNNKDRSLLNEQIHVWTHISTLLDNYQIWIVSSRKSDLISCDIDSKVVS